MTVLFVFPPQIHPANIYASLPLLTGCLKSAGIKSTPLDLNVEFFNDVLTKDYLLKIYDEILSISEKDSSFLSGREQEVFELKKSKIKEYLSANSEEKITKIIDYVEKAVSIYKSKEDFYKPDLLFMAFKVISEALNLISMRYYPARVSFGGVDDLYFKFRYDDIMFQLENPDFNPFYEYFSQKINEMELGDTKLLMISIAFMSQLVPALTFAKLVKQKFGIPVSLGGCMISRISDAFVNHSEMFGVYFDYLSLGDGERAVVELAKCVTEEGDFSEVKGLIYKKEKVFINEKDCFESLDFSTELNLEGLDFSKYFIPEIILTLQVSKGCSWGRCSFCDSLASKYITKSPKQTVEMMKNIVEKYGINKFDFVDDSITAKFYGELADEILEQKLDVRYYSMCRLEKSFTKELFEKMYKSGARKIDWGVETGSKRILQLMNKGVAFEDRMEIIRRASESGIYNLVFVLFGFPTETKQDAEATIDLVLENSDVIDCYVSSMFTLRKHARMSSDLEKFNLTKIDLEEFSPNYYFEEQGREKDLTKSMHKLFQEKFIEKNSLTLWYILSLFGYTQLYLEKYSRDFIKNYKLL